MNIWHGIIGVLITLAVIGYIVFAGWVADKVKNAIPNRTMFDDRAMVVSGFVFAAMIVAPVAFLLCAIVPW